MILTFAVLAETKFSFEEVKNFSIGRKKFFVNKINAMRTQFRAIEEFESFVSSKL